MSWEQAFRMQAAGNVQHEWRTNAFHFQRQDPELPTKTLAPSAAGAPSREVNCTAPIYNHKRSACCRPSFLSFTSFYHFSATKRVGGAERGKQTLARSEENRPPRGARKPDARAERGKQKIHTAAAALPPILTVNTSDNRTVQQAVSAVLYLSLLFVNDGTALYGTARITETGKSLSSVGHCRPRPALRRARTVQSVLFCQHGTTGGRSCVEIGLRAVAG